MEGAKLLSEVILGSDSSSDTDLGQVTYLSEIQFLQNTISLIMAVSESTL